MNTLKNALNYAYLKAGVSRAEIDLFKTQATKLLKCLEENETEEFHKNHLADFLKDSYYKNKHYINTKGTNDLVIHNDKTVKSSVGVIIEVKRPSNKTEMVSCDDLNKKALQELVLYYLRERITHKNLHIKHLIITNIHDWFIFDARVFESCFADNKSLVKLFNEFENGLLAGNKTHAFYKDIAAPAIETCTAELQFTHFNLTAYQALLENTDQEQDKELIPLFKLLSPEHLLKLPFSNDANSLNQEFYNELLHIIGLEEVNEGGKKLIKRKIKQRHSASFLEQAIGNIQNRGEITQEQSLFDAAIELSITWINRILFLKLLEAQLMTYHKQDKLYQFFTIDKITCFADLNYLFFDVLAIKEADRNNATQQNFAHIPYLNSSLFERTELENRTLEISGLRRENLPILSTSVLKNAQGHKLTGELDVLSYLFKFLEAYDFSNDSNAAIKDQPKSLISASVLGLIFEKINGYKDGSFFTPSVITMYMSRETMRLAVLQKFNERKGWQCQSFDDLKNSIIIYTKENRKEANDIINSLKICDPAVGSGHFLVSVLNEIIAIKSELRVLVDSDYTGLSYLQVTVYNDELKITRADNDDVHFEYSIYSKESQRVQKTLFHEKQTIIENCLFGVDINPNSVKICRLRLWIELLKSAYYRDDGKLETLPNIDINIQCGNSLISRFQLDADLKSALKKSNVNIEDYKQAFHRYQNARSKAEKKDMERLIKSIKDNFYIEAYENDPNKKILAEKIADKYALTNASLIEESEKDKIATEKKIQKLDIEITRLSYEIENFKNNPLYKNAFEWRFEFPEALDNEWNFIGFDVIIGNPPYINVEKFGRNSNYIMQIKHSYPNIWMDKSDILFYFIAKSISLSKFVSLIVSNAFLFSDKAQKLRNFIVQNAPIQRIVNFEKYMVFDKAMITTAVVYFEKGQTNLFTKALTLKDKVVKNFEDEVRNEQNFIPVQLNKDCVFVLTDSEKNDIIKKIDDNHQVLGSLFLVGSGMQTAANSVFCLNESSLEIESIFIRKRVGSKSINKYVINENVTDNILYFEDIEEFKYLPESIQKYLLKNENILKNRADKKRRDTAKWWNYSFPMHKEYYHLNKIWCSYRSKGNCFAYDDTQQYIGLTNTTVIFETNSEISLKYLLALLNSKILSFRYKSIGKQTGGGLFEYFENGISKLPIPKVATEQQQPFIELVDKIITAKKAGQDTQDLETQIDTLVYALYGLSAEEIALVEVH